MSRSEIDAAVNALVATMKEDHIEPMTAMVAMTELAARIAYDSGLQDKLSPADNRARWMGGAMLAFDAVSGGKISFDGDATTQAKAIKESKRRHLQIHPGGLQQVKRRRDKNKQARKTRRSQRR